jgi:Subtilase family
VKNERKVGSPLLPLNLRSRVPLVWSPKLPIVAIIDTGLSGKSELGWNFLNDSKNATDDNGHGTEMARLVTEVNPKVMLMPLKALDANGIGTVSKIAAAIDYATKNHAAVILHSFGTSEPSKLIEAAVKRAEMAGVVLVAAAGNDAVDLEQSPQYPAAMNASNLITVAAVTEKNELTDYSNFGKGVHVAALGEGANASRGTSMAAARVAGIASLMKAERPWISAETIKGTLMRSAEKTLKVESGRVNAAAALAAFQGKKTVEQDIEELKKKVKEPKKRNRQNEERRKKLKLEEKDNEGKHLYHDGEMPKDASYDLDRTRDGKPNEPEGRVRTNALQPAGYHDPVPTNTANYNSYFTQLANYFNDIGVAGSKPMQMPDPTAGTSVIGGMSINLATKNLNFMAPVMSLGGRAGMNLSLGLTYNSQVWFKNPATNTMVYNADRGNVAPGWRIGFGAMQGINSSGQVGPYSNSVTGKQSFLYLQPDGTRRDLAYNATTLKYESYDSSYLNFDATTKILKTTSGSQIKFNVSATAAGEYQLLPTEIKDRNGNFITVTYKLLSNNDTVIDYITDTLGRRIDFYYVSNKLTEIRQDRNGTIFKYLVIDYTAVTLANGFTATAGYWNYVYDPDTGDLISSNWVPPTSFSMDVSSTTAYLPSRLTYPTGTNLRMFYTS